MRRPMMNFAAVAAAAATLLAGCNLAPQHQAPALPVPQALGVTTQPEQAAQASPQALEQAQALAWLQSPQLRELVALALSHNRDLRVALDTIEKVRAQYGMTRADLLPGITGQAQGSRTRTAADLTAAGRNPITEQWSAQLGFASYELDLWGRVRNLNEAALQQFLQSQDNQRNLHISLVADVVAGWLTLAANEQRLELARQTLQARTQALELTQRMHALGATSGLVLAQNQTTVDTARGDVAALVAQVARDRNALQLLVGGTIPAHLWPAAEALRSGAAGIALQPVAQELPSTVLLARPDVQAAERNLRAMNANIGAARAALFPTITLTGSLGTGSTDLDRLFGSNNGTWSFIPLVKLPIFDGGRNRAAVQVAEANQRIAVSQYEKAVQTAFREVSDVLADRAQWGERLAAQTSMVASTQKAFDLSQARFKAGVDNYLSVLDAQRSLYAAQQTLITLQLGEQINRVSLWKALGGQG